MTSDQHLALAYYCLAVGSIGSVRALPVEDRLAIYDRMAAIRAEHLRTAAGLVGGRKALADLIDHIVSLPQPALNTVDGTEKNEPGTAQTARGLATTEKESRHD